MKSIMKLSVIAAIAAMLSATAAFADNQRLENRLAREHAKATSGVKTTTIAFGGTPAPKLRYESRSNGHGQTTSYYVAVD
jgi:hypothetical protein